MAPFRDAARYIGITRKITIYLHCKKNCAYDNVIQVTNPVLLKIWLTTGATPSAMATFLKKPRAMEYSARRLRQSWMAWIGKLRKQMTSSLDGSRLQLRKVSHEERKVEKAARRFKLFPIDVEGIT